MAFMSPSMPSMPAVPHAPPPPPMFGAQETPQENPNQKRKAMQPTFLGTGDLPMNNSGQKTLLGT